MGKTRPLKTLPLKEADLTLINGFVHDTESWISDQPVWAQGTVTAVGEYTVRHRLGKIPTRIVALLGNISVSDDQKKAWTKERITLSVSGTVFPQDILLWLR